MLAGHSMGGVMSLMAAALRPDLVRGLVLIEPVFVPALAPLKMRLSRIMTRRTPNRIWPTAPPNGATCSRAAWQSSNPIAGAAPSGIGPTRCCTIMWTAASCRPKTAACDWPVRRASKPNASARRRSPRYRLAAQIRCPVTLIHGEGAGSTCSPALARAFKRKKPDTRVVAVKGVGHFLPMQRPEIVREEINALADRL